MRPRFKTGSEPSALNPAYQGMPRVACALSWQTGLAVKGSMMSSLQ